MDALTENYIAAQMSTLPHIKMVVSGATRAQDSASQEIYIHSIQYTIYTSIQYTQNGLYLHKQH